MSKLFIKSCILFVVVLAIVGIVVEAMALPEPATCTSIISRAEWDARSPKNTPSPLTTPVKYIFIHHTAGPSSSSIETGIKVIQGIQNYHMNTNKWDDIGYSFLIGGDGTIFEGRGWKAVGAHTRSYNAVGYGIALLGDFDINKPSTAALNAATSLIAYAVQANYLQADYLLKGHQQVGSTKCPGINLYNLIKNWPHYSP